MGSLLKRNTKKSPPPEENSKSPEKLKEKKIANNSKESKVSQESKSPEKSKKSEVLVESVNKKEKKEKEEKKEIEPSKENKNIVINNNNVSEEIQDDKASTEHSISGHSSNEKNDKEPSKEKEDMKSDKKENEGYSNSKEIDEINTLIFPIMPFKKPEESKNSENTSLSSFTKSLAKTEIDFYNMNLTIPENLSKKNNIISSPISFDQSSSSYYNSMENSSSYYLPNTSFISHPFPKTHKGKKYNQKFSLSYFVPVTFSCSVNDHNEGKHKGKYIQDEKEFFSKIIKISDVSNMDEFWKVFQHMKKPNQCPVGTEYHLFKKGIVPMWEDDMNKEGGKLTVLLTLNYSNLIWEEVAFNFCKGFLPYYSYINGIVISARQKFSILSFWIKTKNNHTVEKIRYALGNMLQTPSSNCFDFIAFN